MNPSLEFRIPIAPTPAFYSNIRLAAMSLAALGEPYASAPMIVSAGYNADIDRIITDNPWSRDYPVRWYTPPPEAWSRGGFEAGVMGDRFPDGMDSDIVIQCDADLCVLRRLDDLLEALSTPEPTIAGCMAHFSPFPGGATQNDAMWRQVFATVGLPAPRLDQSYSLVNVGLSGGAPPYFNAGFLALNSACWHRLSGEVDFYTPKVREFLAEVDRNFFAIQVALTLAVIKQGIRVVQLGLGYNCPNDERVFDHGIRSEDDVRVVHFLRNDEFDRHNFLVDRDAFERFVSDPFRGRINRLLRNHVLSFKTLCEHARRAE